MIDSGSALCSIAETLVNELRLEDHKKKREYKLISAHSARFTKKVIRKVRVSELLIQGHQKTITLDIMDLAGYDIVFRILWLKKHNPHLN